MTIQFVAPETPDQLQALVVLRFGEMITTADFSHAVVGTTFDPTKVLGGQVQNLTSAQLIAQQMATAGQDAADSAALLAANQASNQKVWGAIGTVFATIATAAYGPVAGAAVAAAAAAIGKLKAVSSGPGACGQSPPTGPNWSQLKAWSHYTHWQSADGCPYYGQSAHAFENWANSVLEYNDALRDNCYYSSFFIWRPILLTAAIQTWNSMHAGPSRTVTRTYNDALGSSYQCPTDPIGEALDDLATDVSGSFSFVVNDGPLIPQKTAAATPAATPAATSTVKKALVYTGIAAGVGAAGIGVYAAATGATFMGVVHGLVGGAIAAVNPLPVAAKSMVSRRRRRR